MPAFGRRIGRGLCPTVRHTHNALNPASSIKVCTRPDGAVRSDSVRLRLHRLCDDSLVLCPLCDLRDFASLHRCEALDAMAESNEVGKCTTHYCFKGEKKKSYVPRKEDC